MILVKLCGLGSEQDVRDATSAGADYLGFIFAPSMRQVDPDDVARWLRTAREAGTQLPTVVGVFVESDASSINAIARQCGLDIVQLSGGQPPELAAELERPVLPVVHVREEEASFEQARAWRGAPLVLVDAWAPDAAGGTGVTADWGIAAELARELPIMLAGGLTPANVRDAIATVRPAGVDVSSGTERNGRKDAALLREFVVSARGKAA